MAYTAWSVVFGEQPTAAKWNQLGTNDAGFKDGTNIDNLAILTRHIAALNVTKAKIEAAVTDLFDYSTTEKATGFTWIDGKIIYKKTINFGVSPNNTTKNVAHGISNINEVIKYEAFTSTGAAGNNYMMLPFVESSNVSYSMSVRATNTNITIKTSQDNSPFTNTYVTIFYTKV